MNALQKAYMKKLTDFKTELNAAYRKAERFLTFWRDKVKTDPDATIEIANQSVYFKTASEIELYAAAVDELDRIRVAGNWQEI